MFPAMIAPSLLAADFARLGEEAARVIQAGADMLHFDVMDNHYVPNLTMGPMVCQALVNYGISVPIDVHLMVKPVDAMIEAFAKAGAHYITFHPEASEHIDRSLALIQDCGCKGGLALNPATPIQVLEPVMERLDMILLMSVNPGFGGQTFIARTLKKIAQVRTLIDESTYSIRLEVDGGIGAHNIAQVAAAGADTFVAGSAVFSQTNYSAALGALHEALKG